MGGREIDRGLVRWCGHCKGWFTTEGHFRVCSGRYYRVKTNETVTHYRLQCIRHHRINAVASRVRSKGPDMPLGLFCRHAVYKIKQHASGKKLSERRRNLAKVCTLTPEYLHDLWLQQEGRCAVTGVMMEHYPTRPNSGSVDRLLKDDMYNPGRVRWVCSIINVMRGVLTDDEFIHWCKLVYLYSLSSPSPEPPLCANEPPTVNQASAAAESALTLAS